MKRPPEFTNAKFFDWLPEERAYQAIQEFRVLTNQFSAEYGSTIGGIVAAVGVAIALVLDALGSNINFSYSPSEVAAKKAPINRTFRIGGLVEDLGGILYGTAWKGGAYSLGTLFRFSSAMGVRSVSVSPDYFLGGESATGTVALTEAAPPGGVVVSLTSAPAAVRVPSTVSVAAGATTASFSAVERERRRRMATLTEELCLRTGRIIPLMRKLRSISKKMSDLRAELDRARKAVAIDRLPDTYREVLLLRDIEELSGEEAANVLGVTSNAVKIRLHRARQALRTLLDPYMRPVAR